MRDSRPDLMQLEASPVNLSRTTGALCELGTVVEPSEPRFHHLSNGDATLTGWFVRIQLASHLVAVLHTCSSLRFYVEEHGMEL